MIVRKLHWLVLILAVGPAASFVCPAADATEEVVSLSNRSLHVAVRAQDGSFELWSVELRNPILTARVGAEVDHHWIWSNDYPKHQTVPSNFQTALGSGHQVDVSFTGLANKPDLKYILRYV